MGFKGKIVFADGTELTGISGDYQIHTNPNGIMGWTGSLLVPSGKHIGVGDYQLVLDDGRSAYINIFNIPAGSRKLLVISFKGTGPPP
jgi:hypothetical protein